MFHTAERVVAGASNVIGYTNAGRPVFAIAGGDHTVAELGGKLTVLLTSIRDIAKAAEDAGRELTGEEQTKVKSMLTEAKDLKKQIETKDGMAALNDQLKALGEGIGLADPKATQDQPHVPAGGPFGAKRGSAGRIFGEHDAYKAWMKGFPNGLVPESTKGISSPPIGFGGMDNLFDGGRKTLITGVADSSAGGLVYPQHLGLVDQGMFQRPLVIRDLITVAQTATDSVDYVVENSWTINAAPVAEATAASGTSGTKPESGFDMVAATANVRTIAHWIPATKRALSDAGQIRALIDVFLMYGLDVTLENEVIAGDGTGQHLLGILSTPNVQNQPYSAAVLTTGGLLETSRKAITKVQKNGRTQPNAFVFTPEDWEGIELQRMKLNPQYDFGGRMAPSLHGLPVVLSQGLTVGQGIVANWRFAVLWDREQASIQVSDSHSDFFVRNLVAFLAELRAAFGVFRPAAFCTVDLTP